MKKYDVFISHAYEDKSAFSNELAHALKRAGLKIWYSGFDLKVGDSIAESINQALQDANYGIVVISPVYIRKQWAMNELNALFATDLKRKKILPVYHTIKPAEVLSHFPLIADRFALSSELEMAVIVNKLMQVIKGKRKYTRKNSVADAKSTDPEKKTKKKADTKVNNNQGFIALGNMTINAKQVAGGDIINKKEKK